MFGFIKIYIKEEGAFNQGHNVHMLFPANSCLKGNLAFNKRYVPVIRTWELYQNAKLELSDTRQKPNRKADTKVKNVNIDSLTWG